MDEVVKSIVFEVLGQSIPQGSTKSFYIKKLNRVVTTHGNKSTDSWRLRIATEAQKAQADHLFYNSDKTQAYTVTCEFVMERPRSTPKKIIFDTKRPDLDKLIRSVLDAITDVLIPDDAQVVGLKASKRYCSTNEPPHLHIEVSRLGQPPLLSRQSDGTDPR